jgi:LysM repeat protein
MRVRVLTLAAAAITLAAPATASADFPHTVYSGESLWSVAAADGLSVDQLAAANGLSGNSQIVAGSTLMIPPQSGVAASGTTAPSSGSAVDGDGDYDGDVGTAAPATSAATVSAPSRGSYVVQPGDTLSAIAARAGMSVSELAAANGLDPNGILVSGKALVLSGGSGGGGAVASGGAGGAGGAGGGATGLGVQSAGSSQPVGSTAEGSSSGPPYPTAESVAPSEVGQIAAANGVPSSLAEAIAYQESGFNNGLTSNADARGVMQILPGTWNWISQNLAGSTPLDPASAGSNIRAGALLLHSLLNATGGNSALAAAGYYQGLPSVLAHGVYPSTQNYVNNVLALQRRFGDG